MRSLCSFAESERESGRRRRNEARWGLHWHGEGKSSSFSRHHVLVNSNHCCHMFICYWVRDFSCLTLTIKLRIKTKMLLSRSFSARYQVYRYIHCFITVVCLSASHTVFESTLYNVPPVFFSSLFYVVVCRRWTPPLGQCWTSWPRPMSICSLTQVTRR